MLVCRPSIVLRANKLLHSLPLTRPPCGFQTGRHFLLVRKWAGTCPPAGGAVAPCICPQTLWS